MDPFSLASLVESSIGLAMQCASVGKRLNNIAGQYKHAKINVESMLQNLETMQLAWECLEQWSKDYLPNQGSENEKFVQRLGRLLEAGTRVMDALEEELSGYDTNQLNFAQRSRLVWKEDTLRAHQSRIRDQASSMTLLLQAIQL